MRKLKENLLSRRLCGNKKGESFQLCLNQSKERTNLPIFIIGLLMLGLLASLMSCTAKLFGRASEPNPIPKQWEKPPYIDIKKGFYTVNNAMCITVDDAKAVIKNQMTCDVIREDLLDQLKATNRSLERESRRSENNTSDKKKK